MFYYVKGTVAHTAPYLAVIDCGGVGYACRTTNNTLARLKKGESAKLFTHLNVREDAMELYGFATENELNCFQLLISVSGVGIAVFFDLHVGSFACRYCGKTFIPSAKAYVFSLHTLTARRLTCPHCGKTGLCKKKSRNKDA